MDDREKARQYHEQERSKKERVADESFRSTEVTENYQEWRAAPGRKDFEGVDTIPPERKKQRAEQALGTAQDLGLVSEFVEADTTTGLPGDDTSGLRGVFSSGEDKLGVKTTLDEDQRQETLAHEVGHAVDYGEWNSAAEAMQGLGLGELEPQVASERLTGEIGGPIDDPDETTQELIGLSKERRGEYSKSKEEYRESPNELFADFLGDAILRPRNTKAKTDKSREELGEQLSDPPEKLGPTREFFERELPDNFLPGL